jgi:NAD(P)-dependent dehydrogenase (short-subunit alcohol dehydrogenase family)
MTTPPPVALVTGASSGIGRAAALALADAGYEVVGTSRDSSRVTDRGELTFVDLDVTDDESVASAVERVIDRFGRIDVVVNNAGVGVGGAAEESSVAQAQGVGLERGLRVRRLHQQHPEFIGLTGDFEAIQSAARSLGVNLDEPYEDEDGSIISNHGTQVIAFLPDDDMGRVLYTAGVTAETFIRDLPGLIEGRTP